MMTTYFFSQEEQLCDLFELSARCVGRVTMTTESCKNGAIIMYRVNLSGYVEHASLVECLLLRAVLTVVVSFSVWVRIQ